ncbi:ribonuclease P protein component [bacterium]|nr:ribonuclease P protein component [bacterium]
MLNSKYRLRKNIAFVATFKLKNTVSNEFLTLYKGKDKSDFNAITKVGFIVSKKVHKRAVKRNKIKRRLREIYWVIYKNNQLKNLENAISLVFIAHGKILDLNYHQIKQAVMDLIDKF